MDLVEPSFLRHGGEEFSDSPGACDLHSLWRHRHRSVLREKRDETVDVDRIPGGHESSHEDALPLGRRSSAAACSLETSAGTLECTVDCGEGVPERLSGLLRRPPEDVAQDEHGSLFGWQELDRSDEGELDRFTQDQIVEQSIRIWLQKLEVFDSLGWSHALALDGGQANVCSDGVQPGAELRAWLVPVGAFPRAQHRFLERVVCVVERAEHPVAMDMKCSPVRLDQERECLLVHRG